MPEVSAEELASWLNVSRRRVNQLVKEGVLPKRGPEGHPLQESVVAYIRFVKAGEEGGADGDAGMERVKLDRAKLALDRERLEFHQAAGAVVAIQDATAHVVAVVEAARSVLQLVPREHGTGPEDRARLKQVCAAILTEIIDTSTQSIQALAPPLALQGETIREESDE